MDEARFDAIATLLGRAQSRRAALTALLAAVGSSAPLVINDAEAANAVCKGFKEKCRKNKECCGGNCRKREGKKRACTCTIEGKRCLETAHCCVGDVPLFCVSNFCVRKRD